jgi:DNA replication protein DnaD
MNKILLRWQDAGYLTAEDVQKGDRKPSAPTTGGQRQLDADEIAAIKKMFQED